MEEKDHIIELRAHHLLCLQGYQGYGYDEKFKKNLEEKLHKLKNDKKIRVILKNSVDDLCKKCPNLKGNICVGDSKKLNSLNQDTIAKNNEKVIKMDLSILKIAKLKKNKKYSFEYLLKIVNHEFSNINQVRKICKDCKWINECLWYQSRKI
ncbi:MAG: DUF1284 domain-containing protein [Methanobrevibacter sp.]|nr:DUF1284 domain-containing protein [Methanobrevibacter sp.]